MQATWKKLPQNRNQCTLVFTAEEVTKAEAEALEHIGHSIRLPGFRPGKAPTEMIRGKVDAGELLEHMVRHLASPALPSLVKEQNLQPILPPRVQVEKTDPMTVSVIFVSKPAVTVKGADKIAIAKKEVKTDAKDVDRMVRYLLEQERTFQEQGRAAKEGDQVTMDFHGTDAEGKEVAGIRTRNYPVILGSKTLLPGFEEALGGMKKGDAKDFTLTFPENYHAEHLRKKPVTFHVAVTKVEEVLTPELTDEFVKKHGLGETADELKKRIETSLHRQEETTDRQRRERELFDAIRAATKVDLAPELIEQTEQSLLEETSQELQRQNTTLEDWMKKTKKTPQDMHKEMEEQSKKRLQLRFGVEQLIVDRKIEATDADVDAMIGEMLATVEPARKEEVSKQYAKGTDGYEQLRWQRQVEKLVEGMLGK